MTVRVLVAPAPIVTPADVPGEHAHDDAMVSIMIAASIEQLDGPYGLLQRAIGPQTLLLTIDRKDPDRCGRNEIDLPLPPLIAVESVTAVDEDGDETPVPSTAYIVRGIGSDKGRIAFKAGWPADADEVRIQFKAGYDGAATERLPDRVRQAVVLGVASLQSLSRENLHLRAEEFDGIGRQEFSVSESAGKLVRQAMTNLVAGLRVYR